MSLRSQIKPYLTTQGFVCPQPVPAGTVRGCDNQPLFTSEYYILLHRNNELTLEDVYKYTSLIHACIGLDGYLHRAPEDESPDEIDDYLGVLAGYAEFGLKPNFKLPFALWRFPQLVYAYLLNRGVPSILMPFLNVIAGIILATSCIDTSHKDSTSRLLNWCLWQATKRDSIICNLAGKFWYWRQTKIYGTNPMSSVAAIYFKPRTNNPFSKYWK